MVSPLFRVFGQKQTLRINRKYIFFYRRINRKYFKGIFFSSRTNFTTGKPTLTGIRYTEVQSQKSWKDIRPLSSLKYNSIVQYDTECVKSRVDRTRAWPDPDASHLH